MTFKMSHVPPASGWALAKGFRPFSAASVWERAGGLASGTRGFARHRAARRRARGPRSPDHRRRRGSPRPNARSEGHARRESLRRSRDAATRLGFSDAGSTFKNRHGAIDKTSLDRNATLALSPNETIPLQTPEGSFRVAGPPPVDLVRHTLGVFNFASRKILYIDSVFVD